MDAAVVDVDSSQLKQAIECTHGCTAAFHEVVQVKEEFEDRPVWQGIVHVFDVDHPDAKTCYAWSSPVEGSENRRFYAVLGVPPINSAQDAVRAAIVADSRQPGKD